MVLGIELMYLGLSAVPLPTELFDTLEYEFAKGKDCTVISVLSPALALSHEYRKKLSVNTCSIQLNL